MNFHLEVCVDRIDAAVCAIEAGATRIELNQALALDGQTPSVASCRWLCRQTSAPVIAMLRPHSSSFTYTAGERSCILEDAKHLLETGVAGLAFGALGEDGRLEYGLLEQVVRICEPRELVLHRAFDLLANPVAELDRIVNAGVRRILTSGGAATAVEGASVLAELEKKATGRIEILPAAGINAGNVATVLQRTGCHQVHGSFSLNGTGPRVTEIREVRQVLVKHFAKA